MTDLEVTALRAKTRSLSIHARTLVFQIVNEYAAQLKAARLKIRLLEADLEAQRAGERR